MPVGFEILCDLNLVYVRYEGAVTVEDVLKLHQDYQSHPDFAPHQRQLGDLSRVALVDLSMKPLLKLQEHMLAAQDPRAPRTMIVYYAPSGLSQSIAKDISQFWDPFPTITVVTTTSVESAQIALGVDDPDIQKRLTEPVIRKSAE